MGRISRACALVVAAATTAIVLASASASAAAAAELTADDVRSMYTANGYAVSSPSQWADGVQMLAISDPLVAERAGWPTLRVFVFADADAAALYRHARSTEGGTASSQLLSGYGPSAWSGNVALVQATSDATAFPAEPECVPDPVYTTQSPELRPAVAVGTTVDARYLAALTPPALPSL